MMMRKLAETDSLTVAAVIHSPGPVAFASFHDFLLLQTGGRPVYSGPMSDVASYFKDIGFSQSPETIVPLADFIMNAVAGSIEPDLTTARFVLDNEEEWNHMLAFHRLWHKKLGIAPPMDDDRGLDNMVAAQGWRQRLVGSLKEVVQNWFVEYPVRLASQFCPASSDPQRQTPTGFEMFKLCLKRAARQQYTSFRSFFLGTIFVFFIIGAFQAALAGSNLNVLGGLPVDICAKIYPQLRGDCLDLQSNNYVSALQFSGFIITAASSSVIRIFTHANWHFAIHTGLVRHIRG